MVVNGPQSARPVLVIDTRLNYLRFNPPSPTLFFMNDQSYANFLQVVPHRILHFFAWMFEKIERVGMSCDIWILYYSYH
jgi:hypothetical protein